MIAGTRLFEAGHHPQCGRLPATRWAEKRNELTRSHIQIERVNGDDSCKLLTHTLQAQKSAAHRRLPGRVINEINPSAVHVRAKATTAMADGS